MPFLTRQPSPAPTPRRRETAREERAGAGALQQAADRSAPVAALARLQRLAPRSVSTVQRHDKFHDRLAEDARNTNNGKYPSFTTHHKISQAYLKHLADAVQAAQGNPSSPEAAAVADFLEALKDARHERVRSEDVFTMLNNMPINLEVGPDQAARRADPGALFDGNTEPDTEMPPDGRRKRRLTLRSAELSKINEIIKTRVLGAEPAGVTAEQWGEMAQAVRAATAEHQAHTPDGTNVLTAPKDEQWEQLERGGLWAKKKTEEMEAEYADSDNSPLEEAAAHRKKREKAEAAEREVRVRREARVRAGQEAARSTAVTELQKLVFNNYKVNTYTATLDTIHSLLPPADAYPMLLKPIEKSDISLSDSQKKKFRARKKPKVTPSTDLKADAQAKIAPFAKAIGYAPSGDDAEAGPSNSVDSAEAVVGDSVVS